LSYAISAKPGIKLADGRWLLLAVLLHLFVISVPLGREIRHAVSSPADIVVRLISVLPETPPQAEPSESIEEPPAVEPARFPEPAVNTEAESLELRQDVVVEDAIPPITATHLIGLRETVTERVPLPRDHDAAPLELGFPEPFERPGNWRPGTGADALTPYANAFNGMTVPERVEVVDRWLAADGSHNVMVETPAGLRLCGRAQPWDPTNPLVEPIMNWHVCGGDGKVPFRFKPRKKLDWDFIDSVAKETTRP